MTEPYFFLSASTDYPRKIPAVEGLTLDAILWIAENIFIPPTISSGKLNSVSRDGFIEASI